MYAAARSKHLGYPEPERTPPNRTLRCTAPLPSQTPVHPPARIPKKKKEKKKKEKEKEKPAGVSEKETYPFAVLRGAWIPTVNDPDETGNTNSANKQTNEIPQNRQKPAS